MLMAANRRECPLRGSLSDRVVSGVASARVFRHPGPACARPRARARAGRAANHPRSHLKQRRTEVDSRLYGERREHRVRLQRSDSRHVARGRPELTRTRPTRDPLVQNRRNCSRDLLRIAADDASLDVMNVAPHATHNGFSIMYPPQPPLRQCGQPIMQVIMQSMSGRKPDVRTNPNLS
jgi:hypothetical protein